jgi:DNA polymerase III subunit epsilon
VSWHRGPLTAFDLESTGVDVEEDRVVTAAVIDLEPGTAGWRTTRNLWLINPGIEIPEAATAVHGITTEQARRVGVDPRIGLDEIASALASTLATGTPIIGMNVPFDLTMLDRDCRRHGVTPLSDRVGEIAPVVDAMVLDKQVHRFRRGKRRLESLCEQYKVRHDGAHEAAGDAIAAARVVWRIAQFATWPAARLKELGYGDRDIEAFAEVGGMDLAQLHKAQIGWRAEQCASLQEYLRKSDPAAVVDPAWPIKPYSSAEKGAV